MRERHFIATYMMASARGGVIYVGMTSSLISRVRKHREGSFPGFSRTYGCKRLVWFQPHETVVGAIRQEKLIKHYVRGWKTNLIERDNPHWDDLYPDLVRACGLSSDYPDTPEASPAPVPFESPTFRHPRACPEDPRLGFPQWLGYGAAPSRPTRKALGDGRAGPRDEPEDDGD